MHLILASTSSYRAALLRRLGVAFTSVAPRVDETAKPGERPVDLCRRLSAAKSHAVATDFAGAIVIGSDQVATCAGEVLDKPGNLDTARAQLARLSGTTCHFLTGLHLCCPGGREYNFVVPYEVRFKRLDASLIDAYLRFDQPFDCAGSFRSEAAGIALCEWMRGDDPTALIGLPLLRLSQVLQAVGVSLFIGPQG